MSKSYAALGDIATLQAGYGFPIDMQGRASGQYPFAKVGDISRGGRSNSSTLFTADHYIDEVDVSRLRAKTVPAGSILFAKIGEAIQKNHRVIAGCEMLIDNNAMAAIPGPSIDGSFLYHFLKTVDFYRLAPATTVPALRKSDLEKLQVPLPPLPEQRRIAAILDRADALRVKRCEALSQLDDLSKSIFIDIFGDYKTGNISWPIETFETITADTKIGLVRGAEDFGAEFDIPYVRMNAIGRSGEFYPDTVLRTNVSTEELREYQLRPGDFLFNTRNSRELVGKTAIFREAGPYVYNNNLMRIRFIEGVEPEYVAAAFLTPYLQQELEVRKAGTTSVFAIYARDLKTLPVPIPPEALQKEFAKKIEIIEAIKTSQRAALSELNTLFTTLLYLAFRGEI